MLSYVDCKYHFFSHKQLCYLEEDIYYFAVLNIRYGPYGHGGGRSSLIVNDMI